VKKYNTIIFVPHARARFRKFTVSNRFLAASAVSAALVLTASVAFGWAFLVSNRRDREYSRSQAENVRLRASTAALQDKLSDLTRQLDDFDARTRRLSIVAGLSPSSGLGGPSTSAAADAAAHGAAIGERLTEIEEQFVRRSTLASSTPTVQPVRGVYRSGFGSREDPITGGEAVHQGVDIATNYGEPVGASAGGVVEKAEWSGDLGNMVEISHQTGYRTIYGHLQKILVKPGQRVEQGQVIGRVGSTGRSTGPHLHYELLVEGKAVDPRPFLPATAP